jgi:Alpha/beta hydrolase
MNRPLTPLRVFDVYHRTDASSINSVRVSWSCGSLRSPCAPPCPPRNGDAELAWIALNGYWCPGYPHAPIDDVVALAAPGMDVGSAAELRTTARVWAARTERDPIRFVPEVRVGPLGHGRNPTDPRFGARVIDTGTAQGHDVYSDAGTESVTNLARIVLGRHAEVTLR